MNHPRHSARVREQSDSFLQRLNSYALVAGASGVGLIALAEPSKAEIIYTKIHRVIGNGGNYLLDFSGDGTTDLTIRNSPGQYCSPDGSCFNIESLAALPSRSNQVVYNIYGAVAMKTGMRIGPKDALHGGTERMVRSFGTAATGSWINVKNRCLGVEFKIKGKVHYGWVRLSVQVQPPMQVTATLTGYAYETIPNKPILAAETKEPEEGDLAEPNAGLRAPAATLGVLAMGSPGLSIWRRNESVADTPESN